MEAIQAVHHVRKPESFFTPEDQIQRFIPFYLSEDFVKGYSRKKPPWGPLGEFTFLRTYSRWIELDNGKKRKERWYETVKRVVEGCFTVQKKHCYVHKVPWNNAKAQNSAKIMFDLMFNMMFLPPGRGLWMMGTEYIEKHGAAALNNCFQFDTKIITESGVRRIGKCSGTTQRILTEGGKWVDAPISSFGKQKLWKLVLSRQGVEKIIYTTENHRWFCKDRRQSYRNKGWFEFQTKDLRPGVHSLQYVFGQNALKGLIEPSSIGIQHGICYGDGTTTPGERNSNRLELFGEKMSLHRFFNAKDMVVKMNGKTTVKNLPNYFRRLPDISENSSYLLGWLMGYFSADGSVSNGQVVLCSYKEDDLKFVRDVCYKIGIGTYGIKKEARRSNFDNKKRNSYKLTFMPKTLSKDFFFLKKHKESFSEEKIVRNWFVKSVRKTRRVEEVFCATVDGIGKFSLEDNILTGNCAFVSTKNIAQDPIDPFRFLMDMSMLGVGVGFDTKGAGTMVIRKPEYVDTVAMIPDTREGWVETMAITLNGFFTGSQIPVFDESEVRPAGALIRGFGGEASGPGPLMDLVKNIKNLLTSRIGKQIRSTDIVDICCMIGKCVVSGNVRRSALLSLGLSDDKFFLDIKNYEKYPEQNNDDGWRWASNNSVSAEVGQDYCDVAQRTAMNGEPGYVWMENAKAYGRMVDPPNNADYKAEGCNPCSEQTLEDRELCCLVETFPSRHKTYEDYQLTLKYAYLYAKTVTLIPTHWHQTNAVMLRNRRIGTSQSGIIDSFVKHGRPTMLRWCDKGYKYLRSLDDIYSDWLCIPRSIKITSVKPSGTVSLLPGVSPGVHYPHSKFHIRRIRVATNSPLVEIMKKAGYKTEKDVKLIDTTVIEFPVEVKNFIKGKSEVTMWEQFLNAADYQKWWCDNQLSITISFKPEEGRDIANALSIFDTKLKSVSLLPYSNTTYPQMPYEEITEEKYNEMISKISKPDYSGFLEAAVGEKYCDGENCTI